MWSSSPSWKTPRATSTRYGGTAANTATPLVHRRAPAARAASAAQREPVRVRELQHGIQAAPTDLFETGDSAVNPGKRVRNRHLAQGRRHLAEVEVSPAQRALDARRYRRCDQAQGVVERMAVLGRGRFRIQVDADLGIEVCAGIFRGCASLHDRRCGARPFLLGQPTQEVGNPGTEQQPRRLRLRAHEVCVGQPFRRVAHRAASITDLARRADTPSVRTSRRDATARPS